MTQPNLVNFSNGQSAWQFFDPFSGVAQLDEFFSGQNGTGQNVIDLWDWSSGGSQWQVFDNNSSVTTENYFFTGFEASGTLFQHNIDWANGSSQIQQFNPSPGVSELDSNFSGADGAGALISVGTTYSSGGSEMEFMNPQAAFLNQKDFYTGPNESGNLISTVHNLSYSGSQSQLAHPNSDVTMYGIGNNATFGGNVSDETFHYGGQDAQGELLYTTVNFATPGPYGASSAILYYNTTWDLWSGGTSGGQMQVDYRSGQNTSGALLKTVALSSGSTPPDVSGITSVNGNYNATTGVYTDTHAAYTFYF